MTPRSDLELALAAARAAGEAIMRSFRSDHDVRHKSPNQPVTDADLQADAILADRLLGDRPEYGWLSEESAEQPARLDTQRVWIVDPIDGTRSFISGYREFAVSIGLVEGNEPVVGVVLNPARDEVFWATRDGGAYRARHWQGGVEGGRPLRMSEPEPGRTPGLLASRSEIARGELGAFSGDWHVRPVGSTAYKLAGVAAGRGHGFLSRGPKSEWDVAAGALLVEEAGGRVTDARGERLRFNQADPHVHGVLAGTPAVHDRLLRALATLPPPRPRDGADEGPG